MIEFVPQPLIASFMAYFMAYFIFLILITPHN